MNKETNTENVEPKQRGRKKTHNYPSKIVCIVTGQKIPYYWKNLKKRIDTYFDGNLEEFQRTYIHTDAAVRLKNGESVEDIRKDYPDAPTDKVPQDAIERVMRTREMIKVLENGQKVLLKEFNASQRSATETATSSKEKPVKAAASKKKSKKLPEGYSIDSAGRLRHKGRMVSAEQRAKLGL